MLTIFTSIVIYTAYLLIDYLLCATNKWLGPYAESSYECRSTHANLNRHTNRKPRAKNHKVLK
jgi:hypothetical protein